jgi:hypothetical protein
MDINLSITTLKDGILDYAGDLIIVSKRRLALLQDFTTLWRALNPAMKKNFRDIWSDGQAWWTPLSPEYKRYKKAKGFSQQKNVRTGALKEAMTTGQLNIMQPRQWLWGIDAGDTMWMGAKSTTPYPVYAGRKRPFLFLTEDFSKALQTMKRKHLQKVFKHGS